MAIVPFYTCDNTHLDIMTAMRQTIVTDDATGDVFMQVYDPTAAEIRAGVATLFAGNNAVPFSSAMSSDDYALEIRAYNSAGETVGVTIINKTIVGFTANAIEPCTVDYTAIIE
jgi:O-acetylhomoserine/O-acetylserine sulfhydrylase-like pyridoxal-dependent enzyme